MDRTVFMPGFMDYIPDYGVHKTLVSQRNLKQGIRLVDSIRQEYPYFVVYGCTLNYIRGCIVTLDKIQSDIRTWVNEIRRFRSTVGVMVSIEESEHLHAHVLVFTDGSESDSLGYIEQMAFCWHRASGREGIYFDENRYSWKRERDGGVAMLGYVNNLDEKKIEMLLNKVRYNTKSGFEPRVTEEEKRKCFICERYGKLGEKLKV